MNKKWKYKALLTTLALLFLFASTVSAEEISPPFFSHSGGFYSDNFDLRISAAVGMTIRYTTDGSEPTNRSAVYSAPIYIHSPEANAANSPMTMSIRNVPHDTNDGESGGPNFMPEPYYNGMVVRARAFNANGEGSATVTHSYFVERDGRGVFNTPVLSVSIEPEHFIDPVIGIYTNWDDRTWYSATEFDPADGPRHIVFVEAFGANGELLFAQRANAWVAGDWSRQHPRKSLRFNFNQGDGDLTNMYEFIPDTRANWNEPLTHVGTFRHVTARTSDLFESGIRDIVSALVAEPLRADIQNGVFGAIFINGEFWGMYDLREHRHEAYIAAHYPGIRRGSIEINTNYGVGDLYFQEIRPLGDLSEQARYERLKAIVDMDNFIDAFIAGFHLQNWDWLNNNFDYWRTTTVDPDIYGHDGRWRFIIQDFDGALQGEFSWIGQSWDMLNYLSDIELEILPEWVDAWLPEFVINLFSNEEFRNTFAARYSTYAGTIFHPSRTDAVVDELLHARRDTIQGDLTRWTWRRGDIGSWKRQTEHVRTILNSRTDVTLTHILNHYNRTDRGLGLGLDESGFANIRWTINESHGFFDIAGAQIRADLFDRGNLSAYSFGVGDFNADYIRGLPIEFTAHGYQGYVFSHFEISGGINETVHANPAVITPTANDEQITVNAVFERTTPQVTLILQIGNPAIVNHNGNATMDVPPIIINGRTLVPLRAIANILDAEISWNEETREATLVSDDRTLLIPIGTTIPEIEPEISAQIIDGRIMVPLRFIAEFFGADVTWDAAERIIEIIR